MAASQQPLSADQRAKLGAQYRQKFIEGMAAAYGNRPRDAQPISHDKELELWLRPTSPAAQRALQMGGTPEDAMTANRLWAQYMRQQADQMRQGGATADQIKQAGLSDEQIFQACRSDAYDLGLQNGHDDPVETVKYHEKMAKRAAERAAQRQTYQTVGDGGQ